MKTLDPALLKRTFQVQGTGHWSYAYRIVNDQDYTLLQEHEWCLTCWREEITLDIDVHGSPVSQVFTPYNVAHSEIYSDNEGSAATFDIIVDNTTHQIGRYIEQGRGYRGMRAEVFLFNVEAVELGPAAVWGGYISAIGVQVSNGGAAAVITVALGIDLEDIDWPHQTFEPNRCRHRRYGEGRCGMIITTSTPSDLLSCSRTWAACIERRDWMNSQGLPARLPGTFGGEPGIPLERGVA